MRECRAWKSVIDENLTNSSPWSWGSQLKDGQVVACLLLHLCIVFCWTIHLSCGTSRVRNQLVSSAEHFSERSDRCQKGIKKLSVTSTPSECIGRQGVITWCVLDFRHLGLLIPHIEAPHSLSSLLSGKVLSKLHLGKLDIAFGTLVNYAC